MNIASVTTCHGATMPATASDASVIACIISSTCVANIARYRFTRSDRSPASGASTSTGTLLAKPSTPSSVAEPVNR